MKEWEAKEKAKKHQNNYDIDLKTCSSMDCTGLIPSLPQSEAEEESYEELYPYTARANAGDEN